MSARARSRSVSPRVFGLDALRAAAITLVLVNHAALMTQHGWRVPLIASLAGVLGVATFFVLSGYLVGGLLLRAIETESTQSGLWRFWGRRWLRTLPAFVVTLGVNAAVAPRLGIRSPALWRYVTFTQNVLVGPPTFFKEAWSLSIEEWFYLIVPAAAFVGAACWPRRRYVGLAAGGLLLLMLPPALRFASASVGTLPDMPFAPRVITLRLDAMIYGVGAVWVSRHHRAALGRLAGPATVAAGLGAIVLAALLYLAGRGVQAAPWVLALWPSLVSTGVVLLLPRLSTWRARPGLTYRLIGAVATGSYALYLTNILAAHAMIALLGRRWGGDGWAVMSVVGFLVLACVAAAILHFLVERPALVWRDHWIPGHARSMVSRAAPVVA